MDDVSETIAWLRDARQRLGWSAAELSAQVASVATMHGENLSISQQAVSFFEGGNTKSVPRWVRFARMAVDGHNDSSGPPLAPAIAFTPAQIAEQLDLVTIEEIDLEFGLGGTFTGAPVTVQVQHFPRTWIESITSSPPSMLLFARGRGDSMVPTIHDNDWMLIDRSKKTIREQDAIWALTMGDIGMVKRVRQRGDQVTLLSDNPSVPPDQAGIDEVFVVGRVLFIARKV